MKYSDDPEIAAKQFVKTMDGIDAEAKAMWAREEARFAAYVEGFKDALHVKTPIVINRPDYVRDALHRGHQDGLEFLASYQPGHRQ